TSSSITTTIVSSLARRVYSDIFSPKAERPPAKPRWPMGANLACRTTASASAPELTCGIWTPPAPRSGARGMTETSGLWTRQLGGADHVLDVVPASRAVLAVDEDDVEALAAEQLDQPGRGVGGVHHADRAAGLELRLRRVRAQRFFSSRQGDGPPAIITTSRDAGKQPGARSAHRSPSQRQYGTQASSAASVTRV